MLKGSGLTWAKFGKSVEASSREALFPLFKVEDPAPEQREYNRPQWDWSCLTQSDREVVSTPLPHVPEVCQCPRDGTLGHSDSLWVNQVERSKNKKHFHIHTTERSAESWQSLSSSFLQGTMDRIDEQSQYLPLPVGYGICRERSNGNSHICHSGPLAAPT